MTPTRPPGLESPVVEVPVVEAPVVEAGVLLSVMDDQGSGSGSARSAAGSGARGLGWLLALALAAAALLAVRAGAGRALLVRGRAVARAVGLGRALVVFVLVRGLVAAGDRTVAAVGAVEAGALEHDADRREDLAQRAAASRADGQWVVTEPLHHLELLTA